MSNGLMKSFQVIIIIQLFYAFAITILAYSMPTNALNYVDSFSDVANDIDLDSVTTDLQDSVESTLNVPIIELGALVFYSGNILVDLLLNFAFAIPEMIGLVINGFLYIFNVDSYLFAIVELFAGAVIIALYFIGILQLLGNIRSGRVI